MAQFFFLGAVDGSRDFFFASGTASGRTACGDGRNREGINVECLATIVITIVEQVPLATTSSVSSALSFPEERLFVPSQGAWIRCW